MKILIAIEDESFGNTILDFVIAHDWPENSEAVLLHAIEPIYVPAMGCYPTDFVADYNEECTRSAKSLLLTLGTKLAKALPSMKVSEELISGNPRDCILDKAKDWEADLIVVGSHGRSGFGKFVLGSVSSSILATAKCTVMLVRPAQEVKQKQETKQKDQAVKKEATSIA